MRRSSRHPSFTRGKDMPELEKQAKAARESLHSKKARTTSGFIPSPCPRGPTVMSVDLSHAGLSPLSPACHQLATPRLVEHALKRGEGHLTDRGALTARTGRYTGRAAKDRFLVASALERHLID